MNLLVRWRSGIAFDFELLYLERHQKIEGSNPSRTAHIFSFFHAVLKLAAPIWRGWPADSEPLYPLLGELVYLLGFSP